MTDQELRLMVLREVIHLFNMSNFSSQSITSKDVLDTAKQLYDFVNGGKQV